MKTATEITAAVRECADNACNEEYPIRFTKAYVAKLIDNGWSQAESEEVGRRAVGIIDSFRGVAPELNEASMETLSSKQQRTLHKKLIKKPAQTRGPRKKSPAARP